MEIVATVAMLCGFGVYLTERLLVSKSQGEALKAETKKEVEALKAQVDQMRERLNRLEARR